MGNIVSNYAKGRFIEWATLPVGTDNLIIVLFQSTGLPTDATLRDIQYLSGVTAAGAVEATFTNYARKVLSASDITVTVNTSTDTASFDVADQTWTAAGGAANNTLGKLGVFYRRTSLDADSAIRCISFHDFAGATTGVDLLASISTVASAT